MVTSAGVPRDEDVKVLLNVVSNTLKKEKKHYHTGYMTEQNGPQSV